MPLSMGDDRAAGGTSVNASGVVTSGPTLFFGLVANASASAVVAVYDGTSTSGVLLYAGPLTAGQVVTFGGLGQRASTGLYFSLTSGTGTIRVLHK